mgnify:FL=1
MTTIQKSKYAIGHAACFMLLLVAGCASVENARKAQSGTIIHEGERALSFEESGLATNNAITISDLETVALRASPIVFQAKESVILAQIALRDIKSSYIPTVDAGIGYTYKASKTSPDADTESDGVFGGSASLNMLVYDFGRTKASTRRAINSLIGAERNAKAAENATRYAVRKACYALKRSEEMRDVAAEAANISKIHYEQMQARHEVGAVNAYAVTQASVNWAQDVLTAVTASNTVLTARAELNKALGIDSAPEFAISDSTIRLYNGYDASMLMEIAKTNAPALASLRAAAQGASDYVDYTIADLYPSLGISIQYTATHDGDLLWNLSGIGQLSQNIFCAGRKRRAIDAAVSNFRIARAKVTEEELTLKSQLTQAILASIRARQQLDVASASKTMAEENYNIVSQRYEVGQASEIERSEALVSLASAKAAVVSAKYDYYDSQILISNLIGE